MNGFSWFPEAKTIWNSSSCLRPQGVGHDQGQPVGSPDLVFRMSKEPGPVPDGPGLRKPTETIDNCPPLQLLFLQLC